MHFAPDTENTLHFMVDLANTAADASRTGDDELQTPAQLTAILVKHQYSGRFDRDEAELADVVATRSRLRRTWLLGRDAAVDEVNAMLREANAQTQIVRHDEFDWHLHATPRDAPLGERIRVEASLALADVIRMNEYDRLRVCDADDCQGLLVDLSRNGSRRFCSIRCGNRMNMVAYRSRQTSAG